MVDATDILNARIDALTRTLADVEAQRDALRDDKAMLYGQLAGSRELLASERSLRETAERRLLTLRSTLNSWRLSANLTPGQDAALVEISRAAASPSGQAPSEPLCNIDLGAGIRCTRPRGHDGDCWYSYTTRRATPEQAPEEIIWPKGATKRMYAPSSEQAPSEPPDRFPNMPKIPEHARMTVLHKAGEPLIPKHAQNRCARKRSTPEQAPTPREPE